MKRFSLLVLIVSGLVLSAVLIHSCHQVSHSSPERGHDPWVFRSVLDGKARMVTVALDDSFWIAYDANKGGLYKVWKQGVLFDGPVYTYAHGPQPVSFGPAWLENRNTDPWRLIVAGEEQTPVIRYKGHHFFNDQVIFTYELVTKNGEIITITEQPEFTLNRHGMPGLRRIFTADRVPEGVTVIMYTAINSVLSEDDIETNGILEWSERTSHLNPLTGIYVLEATGTLQLRSNGITNFTVYFYPDPTILPEIEAEDLSIPPGLTLIENSDCKTCHNEELKTVGPSYKSIAEKYATTSANLSQLALKVINGGQGVWGEQPMTPHPDLMEADARKMISYILSLDGEPPLQEEEPDEATYSLDNLEPGHGVAINVYMFEENLNAFPEIEEGNTPVFSGTIPAIHADAFPPPLENNFYIRAKGYLNIPEEKNYVFRLISDDGSKLTVDGKVVIDHGGLHGPEPKDGEIILKAGEHPFVVDYFQGGGGASLSLQWIGHGEDKFSVVPPDVLTFDSADIEQIQPFTDSGKVVDAYPGDGSALEDVHPSFDLAIVRPSHFEPKVGGIDFLSDGRMVVSTWDPDGSVFILDRIPESVEKGDPEIITVKRIAKGLAEPLGIKVVDDNIYVLQKQELTHLIDHDKDDIIDEYRTLSNAWQASANFHEFAFGLVYKDGYFYATLATAINPGGASTQPQIPDRGKAVKISRETGELEFIAQGLRTPNGIGMGVDDEIFIADNQGDWLTASKIIHLQPGAWYGSRSVDFAGTAALKETLPVVWLPQDEIGNSPSQPVLLNVGPYKGQMIHGEVTHGGIKRVFVEKVNGQYQGCLFRFTQGLEAGVNRLTWGPDNALYIGGVGNPGNWSHYGKNWFGLQRLAFNGKPAFEMLAVRARSNGMEIEFTQPLQVNDGHNPADYMVRQWWYKPTENYGGPKLNEEELRIRSVRVSPDRKRVFLELPGIKSGHVVYIRLKNHFISAENQELWTTEAWYNLNQIPSVAGFTENAAFEPYVDNQLTTAEKSAGWQLLFDGKTTTGWRRFNKKEIGSAWKVENGTLTFIGAQENMAKEEGGDIVTESEFDNYELQLDWKISEGGNSGLMYHVLEGEKYNEPYVTGPEFQLLDNERHPDAKIVTHRSGDLYDLIESRVVTVKPAGEWNRIRLIINGDHVEHWQNGHKVVDYELGSKEWKELVSKSKWKPHPDYGQARKGRISLQDHGDRIWFKNIKVRSLKSGV